MVVSLVQFDLVSLNMSHLLLILIYIRIFQKFCCFQKKNICPYWNSLNLLFSVYFSHIQNLEVHLNTGKNLISTTLLFLIYYFNDIVGSKDTSELTVIWSLWLLVFS
jgi:hypothetical protein